MYVCKVVGYYVYMCFQTYPGLGGFFWADGFFFSSLSIIDNQLLFGFLASRTNNSLAEVKRVVFITTEQIPFIYRIIYH
jgi:hypothetical protein